jgi:hypothetical protein
MTIVIEESFLDGASYELKHAVNRLRDRLAAADGIAAEAFDVAMGCDNGYGGVLQGTELRVIDAAEAVTGELFLLEQAVEEIYSMLDRIVREGYDSLPEGEFE